jgi:uncharacterized protein
VRLKLRPNDDSFYDFFTKAAQNLVRGTELLTELAMPKADVQSVSERLVEVEHDNDALTHELYNRINSSFVTPFDREDIYQLATELDDVVDYLEEASDLLGLYAVEMPTRHALEQCAVIVKACEQLSIACENLKGMRGVQEALVELKRLEDDGDRILRDALVALFRDEGIDPLIVIRWKDIYEALERALDACETVAHVMTNIVVKNA